MPDSATVPERPDVPPVSPGARILWQSLCAVALVAVLFWAWRLVSEHSAAEQRRIAATSTVWGMHACFAAGATALVALACPLARLLGRRRLLTGAALAALSFAACGLTPRTTRIFYDEHIYMQIGQTIAHTGRAEYAHYARAEYGEFEVFEGWVNKQPNGHPYLLSWLYRLGGASEDFSALAIRCIVAATAALLYFALSLAPLAMPAAAPVAAALAFAFTPLVLWWSRTVAVEPTAVATACAAFAAACVHARLRDPLTGAGSPWTGTLLAAAAAFATYFRPESLLVFPMVAALLWASDRRFLEDRNTWAALALALAFYAPNFLHLWSVRTEDWGATDGRRFDFDFVRENLASNGGYFFQQKWFPLAGALLGLTGIVWLLWRNRALGAALAVWLLPAWGIFVLFYAGGYHYGASSRYALVSAAPVALLVGIGAGALLGWLRGRTLPLAAGSVLLVLNWVSVMTLVPNPRRESNQARADVAFVRELAPTLPNGSLVIAMDPCLWLLQGRNSAHISSVEQAIHGNLRSLAQQFPGGLYVHWDYWLNAQDDFAAIWQKLLVETQATLVTRRTAAECEFALFRIDTPHALAEFGGPAPGGKEWTSLNSVLDAIQAGAAASTAPVAPPPVTPPTAP